MAYSKLFSLSWSQMIGTWITLEADCVITINIILQVAEFASLAQLLPPCLPTCVIQRWTAFRQSCCSLIASASAAARRLHQSASTAVPRLRPLQLLLATCVCFSCYLYPPITSISTAPRLHLLRLLLLDCIQLLWLHLQLPHCVRFDCCSPILHPSAVLEASS